MPFPTPAVSSGASPALDRRIERLREAARSEPRLDGVLLYGSWTLGEADAYSDIEAYLFHLEAAGPGIAEVATWRGMVHLPAPDAAVLLDRSGRLTATARTLADPCPPDSATTAQQLTDELANWTLMLAQVLARGETARSHALLHGVVAPQHSSSAACCVDPPPTGSLPAARWNRTCRPPTVTGTPRRPRLPVPRTYASRRGTAGSGAGSWRPRRRTADWRRTPRNCTTRSPPCRPHRAAKAEKPGRWGKAEKAGTAGRPARPVGRERSGNAGVSRQRPRRAAVVPQEGSCCS